ncbi:hypothetical protein Tco_1117809 [Tanacetum coccineum]
MDTTQAQQKALDDALVAPDNRLNNRNCNLRLSSTHKSKEPTLQVEFNAHAPAIIEKLFKSYVQSNDVHVHPTTITSTKTDSLEALRRKFKKSSPSITSCMGDNFHSQHDEHQEDEDPPKGEKRVKRKDNVIDEDEVIPEDETPELIVEFHNIDKRVPTIFDHARMEATLRDTLSNQYRNTKEYAYYLEQSINFMKNQIVWESRQQDIPRTVPKTPIFYGTQRNPNEPPRCLYNKDLFFLKYGNTKKKMYILSLHKIHAEEFPEPDMEEKLNR